MEAIKNALIESAYQDTAGRKDYTIKENDLPSDVTGAAHWWFEFGFNVIPVIPNTKKTPVSWQLWIDKLSHKAIADRWNKKPSDDLGFIADDKVIVLDADSPASLEALRLIEETYDKKSNLIVKTKKGEHHYFRRAAGTYAEQRGYSNDKLPDNIDVKTGRSLTEGRSMVILPPSTDKVVVINEADSIDDLVEVDQDFIDAVFSHNGEEIPRPRSTSEILTLQSSADDDEAAEILSYIDPDQSYDDWIKVIAGVKEHFNGSELGLMILNRWSKPEQHDCTFEILEYKYNSFKVGKSGGATFASVCDMARKAGADLSAIAKRHNEKRLLTETGKILCQKIESSLQKLLNVDDEVLASFKIDPVAIDKMIQGSFYNPDSNKIFLLNKRHDLIKFNEKDIWKSLCHTFGAVQNIDAVVAVAHELAESKGLQKADHNKLVKASTAIAETTVLDYIKYYNQRDSIEWRVDMFAKNGRIEVKEDFARVILPHSPFSSPIAATVINEEVVEDYKQHFKRFDELLDFIVASRFATDRKKAYLWIKAGSDWGKGFFSDLLGYIGTTVSLKPTQVESIFSGSPVSIDPKSFKRAFALIFNEFKTVKSELKELEKEIPVSAKFKMSSNVEVYAKLFFSAENVAALNGDNGVEDQFANRMSIFEEFGDLKDRKLFNEIGKHYYFQSVLAYTIQKLNREVARIVAMGRDGAANYGNQYLDDFIKKYGLDTLYKRYSDVLPEIAEEMIDWLKRQWLDDDFSFNRPRQPEIVKVENDWYLRSPSKAVDLFIDSYFDHSTQQSFRFKKDEIIKLISDDGSSDTKSIYIKTTGKNIRAIKLKDPDIF